MGFFLKDACKGFFIWTPEGEAGGVVGGYWVTLGCRTQCLWSRRVSIYTCSWWWACESSWAPAWAVVCADGKQPDGWILGRSEMLCCPKLGLYVIPDIFAVLLLTLAAACAGCDLDAAEYSPWMPRSNQKGLAAMSCRKKVVWRWCGVIPAALLLHGLRGGSGTAQQGGRPCASCAREGAGWPCVPELQKSRRVRWWLLLDDNEYETRTAEHGSNSASAYAVSGHGLKSISLHQLKLPLLWCFPHHCSVVNQAGESMQSKNNWAGRESAAMAHNTTEGNARQNVPTGLKQEHCTFWVLDGTWKPTKSFFSGFTLFFFAVVGTSLPFYELSFTSGEA